MLVYRVCEEEEYKTIFSDFKFEELGRCYSRKKSKEFNNHKYKKRTKYLHFFPEFNDIFNVNLPRGNYICIYDIPDDILDCSIGIGYYKERFNFSNTYGVLEYAIESQKIDFSYLKQVFYINKFIDLYDYVEEQSIDRFVDVVYDSENKIEGKEKRYKKTLKLGI